MLMPRNIIAIFEHKHTYYMKQLSFITTVLEFDSLDEFDTKEIETIERALSAAKGAWAPYSNFKVGAAALLDKGEIVLGNNQENAAYPSGLCAERVALFSAHAQYPNNKVVCMAICALKNNELISIPVTPCGSCRQVILESNNRFDTPLKLIMHGREKTLVIKNSSELLPLRFDGSLI